MLLNVLLIAIIILKFTINNKFRKSIKKKNEQYFLMDKN